MSTLTIVQKQLKLSTTYAGPRPDPATAWSATPSTPVSDQQLENQVIDPTEPCFITNKASSLNKQVRWVGNIPGHDEKDEKMRGMIRDFLKWQGFINRDFSFNHHSNIVNLDPNLHRGLEQFDAFAVTCSHSTLDRLIEIAQNENKIAADRWKCGSRYIRRLQIMPSTNTVEYEIVVLKPKYLLPPETYLTRYPTPDTPDQMTKHYQVDSHGVLREVPAREDSPRFPSFRFASNSPRQRQGKGRLNPYVVILAAELKFREYKATPDALRLDAEYESLITKTFELVDLLYWEPVIGELAPFLYYDYMTLVSQAEEGTSAHMEREIRTGNDQTYIMDDEPSDSDSITEAEGSRDPSRPDFYWDGLYHGRDLPLTSDDRAFLRELDSSNKHVTTNPKSSKVVGRNSKDVAGLIIQLEKKLAQERLEHEEQLIRERQAHAEKEAAYQELIEEYSLKNERMEATMRKMQAQLAVATNSALENAIGGH